MERKIGEIFKFGSEWYQCIPDTTDDNCNNCFFQKSCSYITGDCSSTTRSDGKSVAFKKLEKVGEPFYSKYFGKSYQRYKTYIPAVGSNFKIRVTPVEYVGRNEIFIEIKEDMEEKGQCCDNRFEIIAKAKEALLKETNIAIDEKEMAVIDNILFRCWQMGWLDKYDDTEHSNSEKIGKNLKPFDLQKAIEGKPVCTRDGRKARIICFDKQKDLYPIIALAKDNEGYETIYQYSKKGMSSVCGKPTDNDLMMLSEKKEGWVNVYRDCDGANITKDDNIYSSKDAAIASAQIIDGDNYVATTIIKWEE